MLKTKFKNLSINKKIILILLVVFIVGSILSNAIISAIIEKNNIKKIEVDLKEDKKNIESYTKLYTREYLLENSVMDKKNQFNEVANYIIEELNNINKSKYIAYNLNGDIISDRLESEFLSYNREDLYKAIKGETAFTLIERERDELYANFSTPVVIDEEEVGIIRLNKDYSFYRIEGNQIRFNVLLVTSLIFILTAIILSRLLKYIISPVINLASHSNIVRKVLEEEKYSDGKIPYLNIRKSNDEIGNLIDNYNKMLHEINEQIMLIEDDRNNILKLYKHKQDFYNNITHELKTPLTTIKGYAEIIRNNGFKDKVFFDKGIKHITDESERLHKMVVQLLEMAQHEDVIKKPINLSLAIESSVGGMQLKAKRYGNIINLGLENSLYIIGNRDKIKELIINLLDNAIKYGVENTEIKFDAYKNGTNIELRITNKGKGLTKEEEESIFTPFYRADKSHSRESGSSGLGLSICEDIVKDHSGYITVNSIVDEETTFIVTFPYLKEM